MPGSALSVGSCPGEVRTLLAADAGVGRQAAALRPAAVILTFAFALVVLESSNASVRSVLFEEGLKDGGSDGQAPVFRQFDSAVVVAFCLAAFMGPLFLVAWRFVSKDYLRDARILDAHIWDERLLGLVASHLLGVFVAQALAMPKDIMSPGAFAATRALEAPLANLMRLVLGGLPPKSRSVVLWVTLANFLLFFAFLRMEGCLCIWTGHGVHLEGVAFYMAYFLLLLAPAANGLMQESLSVNTRLHPLLIMAVQNCVACVILAPLLLLESARNALWMLYQYREMALLVFWICMQTAACSAVFAALIYHADAFWAVSLRSWRVVYWWLQQLLPFYFSTGGALLSVVNPEASTWSLVMLLGCGASIWALLSDDLLLSGGARPQLGKGKTDTAMDPLPWAKATAPTFPA